MKEISILLAFVIGTFLGIWISGRNSLPKKDLRIIPIYCNDEMIDVWVTHRYRDIIDERDFIYTSIDSLDIKHDSLFDASGIYFYSINQ